MNILYLCDEYPPAKTGEIGTVTKVVAEAMVQKGHTVYVLSGRPRDMLYLMRHQLMGL